MREGAGSASPRHRPAAFVGCRVVGVSATCWTGGKGECRMQVRDIGSGRKLRLAKGRRFRAALFEYPRATFQPRSEGAPVSLMISFLL